MIDMITALLYLAIAMFSARLAIKRWSKSEEFQTLDSVDKSAMTVAAIALGMIWPVYLMFTGIRSWLWKPVKKRERRLKDLRDDQCSWYNKSMDSSLTMSERKVAKDIAVILEDIIKKEADR